MERAASARAGRGESYTCRCHLARPAQTWSAGAKAGVCEVVGGEKGEGGREGGRHLKRAVVERCAGTAAAQRSAAGG
jgi:hypothetical protein